jgi:hypothetical protein
LRFHAGCLLLLAFMAFVQVRSIRRETQTLDEGVHLAAGYSYWRTGEHRLNVEHPPLVKFLTAAPLLFMRLDIPLEHPGWTKPDQLEFAWEFMFHNRIPQEDLILAGRLAAISLTLVLAFLVTLWTRARFGVPAALLALALLAFDPNLIAHGRYVTTDVAVAGFYLLTCALWCDWLEYFRPASLIGAGALLGLALVTKFSALVLLGFLPVIAGIHFAATGWRRGTALRNAGSFLALLVIAFSIVGLTYGRETTRALARDYPKVGQGPLSALPAHPWIWGLTEVLNHNVDGHESYLLGERRHTGWWHYFPVAVAVKSTIGVLVLGLFTTMLLMRARPPSFTWAALGFAAVAFFVIALTSRMNLGLRHIFPVYVTSYVVVAIALTWWAQRRRWVAAVALVLVSAHAIESAFAYPHYLPFFNVAAGGPTSGPKYLVDSNLDWGQDGHRLKEYLAATKAEDTCIAWFGSAPLSYLGIQENHLPGNAEVEISGRPRCLAIISATLLQGLYAEDRYSWLRQMEPVAHVGHSIYIFDLRGPAAEGAPATRPVSR